MFGAKLIFIYVYESFANTRMRQCIGSYTRLGVIETIPWSLPKHIEGYILTGGQYFTMTECNYRLMYRTKYMIEEDIDELIVPMRADNWSTMINQIDQQVYNASGDQWIASYNFRSRHFPLNWPDTFSQLPNSTQEILNNLAGGHRFHTLSRMTSEDRLFPWGTRTKVMGRPERIVMWEVHFIYDGQVVPVGMKNHFVNETDGVLHHYRLPVPFPWTKPCNSTRMLHFTDDIITRLNNSVRMCNT